MVGIALLREFVEKNFSGMNGQRSEEVRRQQQQLLEQVNFFSNLDNIKAKQLASKAPQSSVLL